MKKLNTVICAVVCCLYVSPIYGQDKVEASKPPKQTVAQGDGSAKPASGGGISIELNAPAEVKTQTCPDSEDDGKFVQILILPTSTPPTRTRLSFDNIKTGEHAEVEWSPIEDSRAGRTLILAPGCWHVSTWSEPIRYANAPSINYAWPTTGLGNISIKRKKDGDGDSITPEQNLPDKVTIYIGRLKSPSIDDMLTSWTKADGGATGGAPLLSPYRSFSSDLSNTTKDVVTILGEIITERVTAKGMRVLKERVNKKLKCGENGGDAGNIFGDDTNEKPAFKLSQTCKFIESVRFETLGSQGDLLLRAITEDIKAYTENKISIFISDDNDKKIIEILLNGILEQNKSTGLSYEQMMRLLSIISINLQEKSTTTKNTKHSDVVFATTSPQTSSQITEFKKILRYVLAIAAQCRTSASCDSRSIAYITENIINMTSETSNNTIKDYKNDIINISHNIILASSQSSALSNMERALLINEVIFDALDLSIKIEGGVATKKHNEAEGVKTIIEGMIRKDINYMIRGILLTLATSSNEETLAAMRTLSAIAAFLDLDTSGSVEDQAMRRAAKKRSLELLIDSVVGREDRSDEWIGSLHGSFAVAPVGVLFGKDVEGADFYANVSLPLGLAATYWWTNYGFQVDADMLNLGAYIRASSSDSIPFNWADIFSPSIELKFLFLDKELPLSLGIRGYYFPRQHQGAVTANIGFDVPLFDFN